MKVLKSKGFRTHQDLVEFVAENKILVENIHTIVAGNLSVILFYLDEE